MAEQPLDEHRLTVTARRRLELSGVREVCAFDEETLLLDTAMGRLTVKGEKMKIAGFHRETGDFCAEGRFHAFAYAAAGQKKTGVLARLFR